MKETRNYYANYVNSANLFYKNYVASEHAMVTDYFGSSCSVKGSPYINNCNFDLAGEILKWIYGPLNAKNTGTLGGGFVEFHQSDFISSPISHGMANTGWAYVPASCGSNQVCRTRCAAWLLAGSDQDPGQVRSQHGL